MPCLNHYRWWYRCRRYIGFVCVERIDATTTSPSGGCGDVGWPLETRARIARGWLRRLGIADKMVSVAPGSRSKRAIRTTKEEEEEEEVGRGRGRGFHVLHTESYTFDRTRSYIVRDKRNSSWGKIDSCNGSATRGKVRNHRHGKIDNIAHMHFGSRATLVYMPVKKVLKCYTYKVNAEPMRPNNVSCRISMLTFSKQTSRPPMLSLRRCKIPSNLFESISF